MQNHSTDEPWFETKVKPLDYQHGQAKLMINGLVSFATVGDHGLELIPDGDDTYILKCPLWMAYQKFWVEYDD